MHGKEGGMHGDRGSMHGKRGRMHGERGACMACTPHEIRPVIARAVRILLECILVKCAFVIPCLCCSENRSGILFLLVQKCSVLL